MSGASGIHSSRRIAYLILAHHQPDHLLRLIQALRSPNAFFFVHVDAKVDLDAFAAIGLEPQTILIAARERVFWGGFSQVRATLNLLSAAHTSNERFVRYVLLSGADFPIKPRIEIERILTESRQEFLRIDRRLTGSPRNAHFACVEGFHWNDNTWFNRRAKSRSPALHYLVSRSLAAVARLLPVRRFVAGLTPYQGAQWWALTENCVDHVLRFVDEHPEYANFHQLVKAPDEIFFHSIIKASPFAPRISHDFEVGSATDNEHGIHYIDWNAHGVPLPKVLDENDLNVLRASKALLARKFEAQRSKLLLDQLAELQACDMHGAGSEQYAAEVP